MRDNDGAFGFAEYDLATKKVTLKVTLLENLTNHQASKHLSSPHQAFTSHVNEMIKSELLRESAEWEKQYPIERYYEPNFPVFKAEDCAEFKALCDTWLKR